MKLLICGDLSVTDASREAFARGDVKATFGDFSTLTAQADYAMVNLECALTESEHAIRKFGPNLKAPVRTAEVIREVGFDGCLLSNNHIFDFGKEGMRDTLAALEHAGLDYTGFGESYEDSRKNFVVEKNGVRVVIVNVCEHEYTYATDKRMGARPFDEFETMEDIRHAKREEGDYVVVVYHGGHEQSRYPSPRLRKACREMVRCGADVVLCQHSHCIGVYEAFEGGHILYGQGNFLFTKPAFLKAENGREWHEGLAAMLEFTSDGFSVEYIPVTATEEGIRLTDAEETATILSELAERNRGLEDGGWLTYWERFCRECSKPYYRCVRQTPESTSDEYQHFAHYLDCEAHADVLRVLFPTWNSTNDLDVE